MNKMIEESTAKRGTPALAGQLRATLYNWLLQGLTPGWYRNVLERLPAGAHLLDVGIGTGCAISHNAALICAKQICVVGVDIDPDYLRHCRQALCRTGLSEQVSLRLESIYDHRGGPYDAVYFSASFMLLPNPVAALHHVVALLAPGGRIYFTQTFHRRRSRLMEWIKPLLYRFTTIHFGRVTYEVDFRSCLAEAGLEIEEFRELGRQGNAAYCLAVAIPEQAAKSGFDG